MRGSVVLLLPGVLLACGTGRSGSPVCGLGYVVGPTVIQEQLQDARMVLTEAPRGLPASLPGRVAGKEPGLVVVGYDASRNLVLRYQGPSFPSPGAGGFGLLVVDDTSSRVQGVMVYESPAPRGYPKLGTLSSGGADIPIFGVRVDWTGVSNPKCPLLGDSVRATQ
ncbi:MAG TPA: hypothetical protein VJN62_10610 [Gemmatimonadales bacterium]|nr:hypothetical protein [Gemmatimonadales bacterium]